MRVYVASSWRNAHQPEVVKVLRELGHSVYDFRSPDTGGHGFGWRELDPAWESWDAVELRQMLEHPIARQGFASDMTGLLLADACVLVLPSGRSAHLELGWAAGAGKRTYVLSVDGSIPEPELMYAMCTRILVTLDELRECFS